MAAITSPRGGVTRVRWLTQVLRYRLSTAATANEDIAILYLLRSHREEPQYLSSTLFADFLTSEEFLSG